MTKRILVLSVVSVLTVLAVVGAGITLAQTGTPTPVPAGTAWVGVSLADLNQKVATRLNISQTTGVAIVAVSAGSPAEKAGLKVGDVVTSVDGKAVSKSDDAVAAVRAKKAGDAIAFAITRGNQNQTVNVTAAEMPAAVAKDGRFGTPDLQGRGPMAPGTGWGHGFGLGNLPGLKDQQGLTPEERFKQFLGQQFRYLDKDGKAASVETVYGIVVEAKADSITIKPNDPAKQQTTYAVNSDTKVGLPGNTTVERLKAGDPVVVTTSDGKTALSVSGSFGFPTDQSGNGKNTPNGRGGFPGNRGTNPVVPKSGTTS